MPIIKFLFFIAGIALLAACTLSEKPPEVLSQEEMVHLLAEIYIIEEKVKPLKLGQDSTEALVNNMKGRLLDSLNISDAVFRQSLDYYWNNQREMERIYTAVVDSLNLREQALSLQQPQ